MDPFQILVYVDGSCTAGKLDGLENCKGACPLTGGEVRKYDEDKEG